MKININNRTIEVSNRASVYNFKNEKTLNCVSYRKKDLKDFKMLIKFITYCIMPYEWLDKRF